MDIVPEGTQPLNATSYIPAASNAPSLGANPVAIAPVQYNHPVVYQPEPAP